MERLNKMAVRKMTADSQEYRKSNLWIIKGTPQELWNIIWDHNVLAASFCDDDSYWYQPLQRNVACKLYRTEKNKL